MHSIIDIKTGYNIDSRQENTIREILGFNSKIIYAGYNYSERKLNIIDIDRIHLCSDVVIGSIRNEHRSILFSILFTIILNEAPGQKLVRGT